ncbi:YebC/PmpR family DNA-binding transcriptional regulator [Candidatus Shapirobacteria bacterium]|nr:YebC/PmpR family DNA-binding transcriptional regulator [Candidatus Shapirobacteria bacterium]
MSGHSKWANIKNRKGAQDKKRSEAFTKAAKDILTAIREGGGNTNPDSNVVLKAAIEKSRAVNMPKENIDRLLSRFESRKNNLSSGLMEAYGPYGIPMLIEFETDNKNRILSEVKLMLRNYNGNLGENGSVAFLFDRVGEIVLEEKMTEEQELELIDLGVMDVAEKEVITRVEELNKIKKYLEDKGIKIESAALVYKSKSPVNLRNETEVGNILDLIEELEENDDIVNVFAAFDYV